MNLAMLSTVAMFVASGLLLGLVGLWLWNYRKTDDAPEATRMTTGKIVGFVSGMVFAFVVAIQQLGELAGLMGDVVAVFPGGFGQLALGALAIGGFAGVIELTVVTATIFVVLVIFATAAVKY